ncbi:MAG TPA: HEPN domain-containing protein [Candidatus Acidoferrum sp.]|nr:HEPN domain-containing protein [Candidatus Acidoferrum sp.]
MTWTQLLANNEVQRHRTSKKELDKLRAVVARDLVDSSLNGVSADRRFATAYNAALQAAKMAIACAGYRVVGAGHHRISFEVVELAMGKATGHYCDYFDRCRRKRNVIDYDDAFVATETEAIEIVTKATEFVETVEKWIAKNHPPLKA